MTELMSTLSKELKGNPTKIAELIKEVAVNIDQCKGNLSEIKSRGFWKQLTSNNTQDLAETLIVQNDTISTFMNIIQSVLFLNMNNTLVLGQITEALKGTNECVVSSGNQYTRMAMDFLDASITASENVTKKFDEHEKVFEEIKKRIIERSKVDEEQNRKIAEVRTDIERKSIVDVEQSNKITGLQQNLRENVANDQRQEEAIAGILEVLKTKKQTDLQQTSEIENILLILETAEGQIKALNKSCDEILVVAQKPSVPSYVPVVLALNTALSLVAIGLVLFR